MHLCPYDEPVIDHAGFALAVGDLCSVLVELLTLEQIGEKTLDAVCPVLQAVRTLLNVCRLIPQHLCLCRHTLCVQICLQVAVAECHDLLVEVHLQLCDCFLHLLLGAFHLTGFLIHECVHEVFYSLVERIYHAFASIL